VPGEIRAVRLSCDWKHRSTSAFRENESGWRNKSCAVEPASAWDDTCDVKIRVETQEHASLSQQCLEVYAHSILRNTLSRWRIQYWSSGSTLFGPITLVGLRLLLFAIVDDRVGKRRCRHRREEGPMMTLSWRARGFHSGG